MSQIGMDPVDVDKLVQQAIAKNQAVYDALNPEDQAKYRAHLAAVVEGAYQIAEQERRKTIDHVLEIMDLVGCTPLLREAIVKFKDFS